MAVLEEPLKEALALKNYIGGEWGGAKGELVDVVNPATCKVIAKVPISTRDEIKIRGVILPRCLEPKPFMDKLTQMGIRINERTLKP